MTVPAEAEPLARLRAYAPSVAAVPSRFKLIPYQDITLGTAPAYLVKGLIPRVGLVVVWGPPKCGKSFLVFDLMMHVALGWQYRDRRTKQGAVVYCALEGGEGFRARMEAFRVHHGLPQRQDVPFFLVAMPINLSKDAEALAVDIAASLGDTRPASITIDTLNRSLAGSEKDDKDMALYIQAADLLRERFACVVVIIHHCGIDPSRPRGHTSLTGAADAQLSVKRDPANNIELEVEWMKDGPQGERLLHRLEPIDVGTDDDGEAITSCIVQEVDPAAALPGTTKRGPRLSGAAKTAMRALETAISDMGTVPPANDHIPPNLRCVMLKQWRDCAYRLNISGGEDRAKQTAFKRASEKLIGDSLVGSWEDWVWPVRA
jgi:hypothetical protein